MVFSSIPAYLDPSNWQQQIIGNVTTNPLLAPQPPPPPPPPPPHGGGQGGSIRPGSMSERARLANIPMPESALNCPRCESTNTKFCYFNNYSLSQPRHFCKTCRRYWTRGGALRNVPVGGGCRRNKRSKSSASSKSPASSDRQTSATSSMSTSTNSSTATVLGLTPPPLRFMSPLSQLNENFTGAEMGLNYSGISSPLVAANEMNFPCGGGISSLLCSGGPTIEPWRQQFPFLGALDHTSAGIYQFHGGESGLVGGESTRPKLHPSSLLSQMAAVKMEGLQGNDQWINPSAAWSELSNFSSSSTSNRL